MATFKPTSKAGKTTGAKKSTFTPTKYAGYNQSTLYGWQRQNQSALDLINQYNTRVNNGEWLSVEDRAKYKSAVDTYTSSGTALRNASKHYGTTYTDEEEKSWLDSLSSLNTGYTGIDKFYNQFKDDREYGAWKADASKRAEFEGLKNNKDYNTYVNLGKNSDISKLWDDMKNISDANRYSLSELITDIKEGDWEALGGRALESLLSTAFKEISTPIKIASGAQDIANFAKKWTVDKAVMDEYLTEDEINGYYYLLGKGDYKKADEYLAMYSDKARREGASVGISNFVDNTHLEGLTALGAGLDSFTSGYNNALSKVGSILYDKDVVLSPTTTLQYTFSQTAENNKGIDKIAVDLAQTLGNQIPNMALNAMTGGASGVLPMSISASGNAYAEMRKKGYNDLQATIYGTGIGVLEATLQKFLGGISGMGSDGGLATKAIQGVLPKMTSALGKWALQTTAGMLDEGLEEGLQEVLAPIWEGVITGEYNPSNIEDVLYAGLLGGLSGGLLEGVPSAFGAAYNNYESAVDMGGLSVGGAFDTIKTEGIKGLPNAYKQGVENINASARTAANEALAIDSNNAYAKKALGRLDKGKNATVYQTTQMMGFADRAKVKDAITNQLTEYGETSDISALAEALTKQTMGEELSKKESKLIEASKYGNRIANELNPENIKSGQYTSKWAESIGTRRLNADVYSRRPSTKVKTKDGTNNTITNVRSVADGVATVELADGKVAKVGLDKGITSDVVFNDPKTEGLFRIATDRVGKVEGWTTETANAMIKAYEGSTLDASAFARGWSEAYNIGKSNNSQAQLNNSSWAMLLDNKTRADAYNIGKAMSTPRVMTPTTNTYKVSFDSTVDEKSLTKEQKTQVKALDVISKALGVNVVVFDSPMGADGKRMGKNGSYNASTRTVEIDLHAGVDGKGLMMFTAAHELTHHMREVASDKFNAYADAVFEALGENGRELLERRVSSLRESGRLDGKTDEEAYDLAFEEVVADSAEKMLVDTDALVKLSESLKSKDKTLWEKVKDYIVELANKIKKIYASLEPDSQEARMVSDMEGEIENIRKLWVEGIVAAAEVSDQVQTNEPQTKDKNSGGDVESNTLFSIRDDFIDEMTNWIKQGMPSGETFIIGETGDVLQGLGAIENDIYIHGDKIKTILSEHPEITIAEIKKIPQILENPILILKSQNVGRKNKQNSRVVIFGNVKNQNGQPVLSVMDLRPTENHIVVDDMQKVTSAYVKTSNPVEFVRNSEVLYAQKNKTTSLLRSIGFQTPIELNKSGFLGIISYKGRNVNISGEKFSNVFSEGKNTPNEKKSDRTYVQEDNRAVMTQERLDYLIEDSGAGKRKDYANKWLAKISPKAYLDLTTEGYSREEFDKMGSEWNAKVNMSNYDYLGQLGKSLRQTPYLAIEIDTGKVVGHDGRHRIRALEMNGIESVEIYVEFRDAEGTTIKYQPNGERWESQSGIVLTNQFGTGLTAEAFDLIPLNEDHRVEIESVYGENANPDATIKYQDRVSSEESFSNRSLLANALLDTVQSDIEYKKLDDYKAVIGYLEAEEVKLADLKRKIYEATFGDGDKSKLKELREEVRKTEARIDLHDKKLLQLESTTALKNVLERAKKQAYSKALEKGREAMHKNVEGRYKTIERNKIKKIAHELDTLLNKGNKKRNVKIGAQGVVRAALDLSNMYFATDDELIMVGIETIANDRESDAVERYKKLYERLHATDDDVTNNKEDRAELRHEMNEVKKEFADLLERERKRINSIKAKDIFSKLIDEYKKLSQSPETYIAKTFDAETLQHIEKLQNDVGDKLASEMTLEDLENLYKAFKMIKTMVSNANNLFKEEGNATIEELGTESLNEIRNQGHKEKFTKLEKAVSALGWNNLKPVYLIERTGSKVLQKLFQKVLDAESVWAKTMADAKAFIDEQVAKYNYKKWDFKTKYEFATPSGMKFKLNLGQMMTIYAYSKRGEQAIEHLRTDGFVFDTVTEKKLGGIVEYEYNDKTAYKITDDVRMKIIGMLTKEQKDYVDAMQKYLSKDMGAKGNEVSIAMYGIELFGEENYLPIHSEGAYLERVREQAKGDVKIKNKGFTKSTTKHARNAIVLSEFDKLCTEHIAEMSSYYAFTLPLEDFYRVYNYEVASDDKADKMGVIPALINAFGEGSTQAIDQLLSDLNGGARTDQRETLPKMMMSLYKKAKVMLSLSVIVQQPSAILRAQAMVDPKYFINKRTGNHKQLWNEMKEYAPVTIIKEMGHFDVGMGKSSADWLLSEDTFMDKVDEFASKPASLADEVTWVAIWNAVKRETASNNPTLNTSSKEFLKKAGERFEDVIRHTQVYDSTLARSGNMRSKPALMQMEMAFMAEPTTSLNMREMALRSKDKKRIARTTAAVYTSSMLNSILVAFIYAMRDDDEDETFEEKYIQALTSSFIDNINPLSALPIAKNVWSLAQGYGAERSDMALVDELLAGIKKLATMNYEDAEGKDIAKAVLDLVGDLSALTGLPVANVVRDVYGIINFVKTITKGDPTTLKSIEDALQETLRKETPVVGWFKGESKGEKLYEAILAKDDKYVERFKSTYKDEDAYNSALRKAIRDNDPRLEEAALARLNGDRDTYYRLMMDVIDEGNFDKQIIKDAFAAEYNYQKRKAEENK